MLPAASAPGNAHAHYTARPAAPFGVSCWPPWNCSAADCSPVFAVAAPPWRRRTPCASAVPPHRVPCHNTCCLPANPVRRAFCRSRLEQATDAGTDRIRTGTDNSSHERSTRATRWRGLRATDAATITCRRCAAEGVWRRSSGPIGRACWSRAWLRAVAFGESNSATRNMRLTRRDPMLAVFVASVSSTAAEAGRPKERRFPITPRQTRGRSALHSRRGLQVAPHADDFGIRRRPTPFSASQGYHRRWRCDLGVSRSPQLSANPATRFPSVRQQTLEAPRYEHLPFARPPAPASLLLVRRCACSKSR